MSIYSEYIDIQNQEISNQFIEIYFIENQFIKNQIIQNQIIQKKYIQNQKIQKQDIQKQYIQNSIYSEFKKIKKLRKLGNLYELFEILFSSTFWKQETVTGQNNVFPIIDGVMSIFIFRIFFSDFIYADTIFVNPIPFTPS